MTLMTPMKRVNHTVKIVRPEYELPKAVGPQDGVEFDEKTERWFSFYYQNGKQRKKLLTYDFEESCKLRNKIWARWKLIGKGFTSRHRVFGQRKARRRPKLTPCTVVKADGTIKHFASIAQKNAFLRRRKTDKAYQRMTEIDCPVCKGEAMIDTGNELVPCLDCKGNGTIKKPAPCPKSKQ